MLGRRYGSQLPKKTRSIKAHSGRMGFFIYIENKLGERAPKREGGRKMEGIKRFEFLVLFLVVGLALAISTDIAFALEKDEAEQLKEEIDKLAKEDPELAKAVREEYKEAVAKGEIDMPDRGETDGRQHRDTGPDPEKAEKEFQDLLKSGKTPEDAEKIMREKYGGPEGFDRPDMKTPEGKAEALERLSGEKDNLLKEGFSEQEIKEIEDKISKGEDPREIFEKHGDFEGGPGGFDRGGPERELTKEEMEKEFAREMGREPTEQEREMMERGDFERSDREMMEKEGFERGDREMMEKEGFERDGFEREGFEREEPDREREERYREDGPLPSPPPEE